MVVVLPLVMQPSIPICGWCSGAVAQGRLMTNDRSLMHVGLRRKLLAVGVAVVAGFALML